MGVTIFYSGTIKQQERDPALQQVALKWARHWKCEVVDVVDQPDGMFQVRDTEIVEYEGPLNGFVLHPHPMAESLAILYGTDGYCWRFCKTQFAGPDMHIEVVQCLREIAPFFNGFKVKDDSGYWDTGDRQELERRMGIIDRGIDLLAGKFPPDTDPSRTDRTPKSGNN
jgi:hypothetical protein